VDGGFGVSDTEQDRFYFRQLLAGYDFARDDRIAQQMVNFCYLIGDRERGECIAVDPAYGVRELVEIVGAEGMKLSGVLVTHYHQDHIGGDLGGWKIEGLRELLALDVSAPVHVNDAEAHGVMRITGASESDLVRHQSGDVVQVGDIAITLLHTPGHTPGSQCFLVDGRLVSGDTLFLDGCGRTDLPGGDPGALYDSLERLASLPDDTVLFPGHRYSEEPSLRLDETRRRNIVFRPKTREQWLMMFGN
jgi:glyoxylase-like metal-dependent hydrolase (beta-lactamase superfamily II)